MKGYCELSCGKCSESKADISGNIKVLATASNLESNYSPSASSVIVRTFPQIVHRAGDQPAAYTQTMSV